MPEGAGDFGGITPAPSMVWTTIFNANILGASIPTSVNLKRLVDAWVTNSDIRATVEAFLRADGWVNHGGVEFPDWTRIQGTTMPGSLDVPVGIPDYLTRDVFETLPTVFTLPGGVTPRSEILPTTWILDSGGFEPNVIQIGELPVGGEDLFEPEIVDFIPSVIPSPPGWCCWEG